MAAERFLERIWERRCHLFRGGRDFGHLLSPTDLPALLAAHRPGPLGPVTMGRMNGNRYERALPYTIPDRVDVEKVAALWRSGYTLILPALHAFWAPTQAFCEALERQSHLPAEMNLYYTPPGSAAYPPHYDTHDVFILQIFGEKTWRLHDSPVFLPFPEERDEARDRPPAGDPKTRFRLVPGDVLYLPRGAVHSAEAHQLPSLHLSLGLYPLLWRDLPGEALSDASSRRAVPPVFLGAIRRLPPSPTRFPRSRVSAI